ncbi:unnamed protein product [Clavelina lepadiformis]|uniref:Maturase K n=1 Tax=Clavelina lepadiformis TaxID=159417 RepID=A0ABP0GJ60_CLALP
MKRTIARYCFASVPKIIQIISLLLETFHLLKQQEMIQEENLSNISLQQRSKSSHFHRLNYEEFFPFYDVITGRNDLIVYLNSRTNKFQNKFLLAAKSKALIGDHRSD